MAVSGPGGQPYTELPTSAFVGARSGRLTAPAGKYHGGSVDGSAAGQVADRTGNVPEAVCDLAGVGAGSWPNALALCGRSRSHVSRSASALQAVSVGLFEISAGIDGPRVGLLRRSECNASLGPGQGRGRRPRRRPNKVDDRDPGAGRNRLDDRGRSADQGHLLPRHQGPRRAFP